MGLRDDHTARLAVLALATACACAAPPEDRAALPSSAPLPAREELDDTEPPPSSAPAPAPVTPPRHESTPAGLVISDESQLEAAVDRQVTIVGVQTRAKIPTVCGVDVDGPYSFSDKKVVVRGVLRRTIVTRINPMVANRGTGTFYSVVDPATGKLAAPSLYEE